MSNAVFCVDERTPCLGMIKEQETELSPSVVASPNRRSKIHWPVFVVLVTAMLVILSWKSSGVANTATAASLLFNTQLELDSKDETIDTTEAGLMAFDEFAFQFDKKYESQQDYEFRKQVYESNLRTIAKHNQEKQHGWTMGVNRFADVLPHEIHKGLDKAALKTPILNGAHVDHQEVFGFAVDNTNIEHETIEDNSSLRTQQQQQQQQRRRRRRRALLWKTTTFQPVIRHESHVHNYNQGSLVSCCVPRHNGIE